MAKIDISIEGVDEASRMFEEVAKKAENLKTELPRIMADMVIAEARSELQNNTSVVTGDLNASIGVLEEDSDSITVGSDLPYAQYVEFGRGPVKASEGKTLHFFTKDWQEVFVKSVGPAEPRPFFFPAVRIVMTSIKSLVNELLQ